MIDRPDLGHLGWIQGESKMDDDQIKANLQDLSLPAQLDLVLSLHWQERLRIIRNSNSAWALVRRMPEEEVLLTLKALGEGDIPTLLAMTSPKQLRFVLDVELWRRDSVDAGRTRQWLSYILACGERKVVEWVENADRELVIIMLSNLVTLVPNEEGVTVPQGLPSIMPDEFFTILSSVPEEMENTRLLLRILRQWDRTEFYKILFQMYGEADAEAEERAYRWRNSRLEEKGLLEFDEAVEIYGYLAEAEARELAGAASPIRTPAESQDKAAPTYPVLLVDSETFFYEVLVSLQDVELQNRLRTEIGFCANRLLAADAGDIAEIDSIRKALNRLFAMVNVALLFLTGGNREQAVAMLERIPIKELFQIGFSRVVDLRTAARDVVRQWWPAWRERGFTFLEYPQDEVLAGLMLGVPQYHQPGGAGPLALRDFRTTEEIAATRAIVEEIAVVAKTCFHYLGIPKPHDAKLALGQVSAGGLEEIGLKNLILTGFVHFVLNGRFRIRPLREKERKDLLSKVLDASRSGDRLLGQGKVEGFLAWLRSKAGYDAGSWVLFESFFERALAELEDEIGKLRSWRDLDPRYVRSLVFARDTDDQGSLE